MNKNDLCIIFGVMSLKVFIILDEARTHFTNSKKSTKNRNRTDQNSNKIKFIFRVGFITTNENQWRECLKNCILTVDIVLQGEQQ
jgi:hypothetical protein